LPEANVILSTLKLRTFAKRFDTLKHVLQGRHVFIYEQDPWEAFIPTGTCRGTYEALHDTLDVTFINTSSWWSNYVNSLGFRSIFTKMWMNPGYCNYGEPWSERTIRVGFKGSLHPHRLAAIEKLRAMGTEVTVLPSGNYSSFLSDLQRMQFFFHEESPNVANAGWAKEVEICSQGCFALRLHEDEASAYDLDRIPGMKTFQNLEQVPAIIEACLTNVDSDVQSRKSVDIIRSIPGWFNLSDLNQNGSKRLSQ